MYERSFNLINVGAAAADALTTLQGSAEKFSIESS
jgi:hypothetical protein